MCAYCQSTTSEAHVLGFYQKLFRQGEDDAEEAAPEGRKHLQTSGMRNSAIALLGPVFPNFGEIFPKFYKILAFG